MCKLITMNLEKTDKYIENYYYVYTHVHVLVTIFETLFQQVSHKI